MMGEENPSMISCGSPTIPCMWNV